MAGMTGAGAELFKLFGTISLKTDDLDKGFSKIKEQVEQAQGKLGNFTQRMGDISKQATETGKSLTTKVSAPIVALGGVSVKTAMDFQSAMSEVSALSGATGGDLKKLEDLARQMGAETVFSAKESADALKYMSLAGWSTEEMAAGLEPTLKLAGAAGMELGMASDIVTDTLSMFGMEAVEATKMTDMLAYAQANSNTDVEGLGEALKYTGASANAMGYDLADTAALLGTFADQGLKGSAAGTTLNAMFVDMKNNAEDGAIAIGKTKVPIVDANGNYRDMADIMADVEVATDGMTQAQKDQALSSVFGIQAIKGVNMVMEAGTDTLKDFEEGIRGSDGAASKMYETMNDNLKGSWEGLKSALSEVAISFGSELTPMIRLGTEWLIKLVSQFNETSPATKKLIAIVAALAAGIGPLIWLFGGLSGAITSIMGLITALAPIITVAGGAAGVFSAAMAGMAAPIALGVAGLGAIIVGLVALGKHLSSDAIPKVNLFGKEVSKGTQEALNSFLDLEKKASLALKQLTWSGAAMSKETAETISSSFKGMADQVVNSFTQQKEKSLSTLRDMFKNSTQMSEEEKNKILDVTSTKFDRSIEITRQGEARVNEITALALKEGRALTKRESDEINKIKTEMTNAAVKTLSNGEKEQLAIMENLRAQSGVISARQAAEVVQNSLKQKTETVQQANEEYKQRLKAAAELRAEGSKESILMADKIVAEAKRQKDEATKKAEEMHQNVVREAKAQAKDHVKEVDWSTGQILSKWDILVRDVKKTISEWDAWMTSKVSGMVKVVVDKFNDLRVNVSKAWSDLRRDTSLKWEEIKTDIQGKVNDLVNKVKAMPGKMADGIRAGKAGLVNSFMDMWKAAANAVAGPANKIIGGANWILDKFGSSARVALFPTPYAKGTEGHPGGPALVNDQKGSTYREAIEFPNGEVVIPEGRNILFPNMPAGTKVMPADMTSQVYRYAGGVGNFAKGIWDKVTGTVQAAKNIALDVFQYISNPSKLVDKVIEKFVSYAGIGGAPLNMAKGLVSKTKGSMVEWITKQFETSEGTGDIDLGGYSQTGGIGFPGLRKTSPFGYRIHPISRTRKLHAGVDMAGGRGVGHPIHSQTGGIVDFAGRAGGYGIMVRVRNGILQHMYAHLSRALVGAGTLVHPGRLIGLMGSTGASTGPHVHYEVRRNGSPIHPGYANGGLITRHHLAEVGEGNNPELIVPLTKPARAKELIDQGLDYLGMKEELVIPITLELDGEALVKQTIKLTDKELETYRKRKARGGK